MSSSLFMKVCHAITRCLPEGTKQEKGEGEGGEGRIVERAVEETGRKTERGNDSGAEAQRPVFRVREDWPHASRTPPSSLSDDRRAPCHAHTQWGGRVQLQRNSGRCADATARGGGGKGSGWDGGGSRCAKQMRALPRPVPFRWSPPHAALRRVLEVVGRKRKWNEWSARLPIVPRDRLEELG